MIAARTARKAAGRAAFLALCFAALALAGAGRAQTPRQPYAPIDAPTEPPARLDPELAALIERLRAAVARGDGAAIDAELSPDYHTLDCFLDPTRACVRREPTGRDAQAQRRRYLAMSPARRIRADLCCVDIAPGRVTPKLREEAVLGAVGAALEAETLGLWPQAPAMLCAPAPPHLDRAAAAAIADRADVDRHELRVAASPLRLREAPRTDAAEIAMLPARRIAPLATASEAALPHGWSAVVSPDGRVGYTDEPALDELSYAGVCFAREATGRWGLVAVVERKP